MVDGSWYANLLAYLLCWWGFLLLLPWYITIWGPPSSKSEIFKTRKTTSNTNSVEIILLPSTTWAPVGALVICFLFRGGDETKNPSDIGIQTGHENPRISISQPGFNGMSIIRVLLLLPLTSEREKIKVFSRNSFPVGIMGSQNCWPMEIQFQTFPKNRVSTNPPLSFSEGPIADADFLGASHFFFLGFFWVPNGMGTSSILAKSHGVRWRGPGTESHIWWHAFHHSFRSPDRLVELSGWLIASRGGVGTFGTFGTFGPFFPE